MLVFGPIASWVLWNTQRETLLSCRSENADTANSLWGSSYALSSYEMCSALSAFGPRLDLIVPKTINNQVTRELSLRCFSGPFPNDALISLRDDWYCLSPAFMFMMLAHNIDLITLIRIGMRLCATYQEFEGTVSYDAKPICSVATLGRVIDGLDRKWGIKKARRAIQYLADGVHSPQEENLYLLLRLPGLLGGYNFFGAVPNMPIWKNSSEKLSAFYGDLCWPEQHVCVEYDSTEWHDSYTSLQQDSIRRMQLTQLGYTVLSMTSQQVSNINEFRRSAETIARLLGKRLYCTKAFYQRQLDLRGALATPIAIR